MHGRRLEGNLINGFQYLMVSPVGKGIEFCGLFPKRSLKSSVEKLLRSNWMFTHNVRNTELKRIGMSCLESWGMCWGYPFFRSPQVEAGGSIIHYVRLGTPFVGLRWPTSSFLTPRIYDSLIIIEEFLLITTISEIIFNVKQFTFHVHFSEFQVKLRTQT